MYTKDEKLDAEILGCANTFGKAKHSIYFCSEEWNVEKQKMDTHCVCVCMCRIYPHEVWVYQKL